MNIRFLIIFLAVSIPCLGTSAAELSRLRLDLENAKQELAYTELEIAAKRNEVKVAQEDNVRLKSADAGILRKQIDREAKNHKDNQESALLWGGLIAGAAGLIVGVTKFGLK